MIETSARKKTFDFIYNAKREPKTSMFCCACHKDIKGKPKYYVHVIDGGVTALHPEDEDKYVSDGGDLGAQPIGSDCARKLGLEWVRA